MSTSLRRWNDYWASYPGGANGWNTIASYLAANISDTNYADNTSATGSLVVQLDGAAPAIPAGAQVRGVRARANLSQPSGSAPAEFGVYHKSLGPLPRAIATPGVTRRDFYTPWQLTRPDGSAWVSGDFISQGDACVLLADNDSVYRVHDVGMDVLVNERPVVSAVGPTGTITTSTPAITWTYTDPDGDVAERVRVIVCSASQGSPDTFINPAQVLYDSGEVLSSAASHQVTTPISDGVRYIYVKVADAGSNGRYSLYATATVTIAANPPAAPTVAAVADNTNNRVNLTVTAVTSTAGQKFTVDRSDDGGVTWKTLPRLEPTGASTVDGEGRLSGTGTPPVATARDHEAPPGVAVRYRAKSTLTVAVGSYGASSASVTVTITDWWLKDPLTPANNRIVDVQGPVDSDETERTAVMEPLGRKYPVVLADAYGGEDGTLDVKSFSEAEHQTIRALIRAQRTLILQAPIDPMHRWIRLIGPRKRKVLFTGDTSPVRDLSVRFVEVDAL